MTTAKFWKEALERAVKTFAQTAAGLMTGDGLGVLDVDWIGILSVAALAFVYSILTSIGSAPVGPPHSPNMLKMLLAFALLSAAAHGAEIVGPEEPKGELRAITVKQGEPPIIPLKLVGDDGEPLEGMIVKWLGPIGDSSVAVPCHGGLIVSTARVGRHEFTAIIVPPAVASADDIEIVEFTVVVTRDVLGPPEPPPDDDDPPDDPPPPGIVTDLSVQARQWLATVPANARGPQADVASALREIVNAQPPLGITEMELFLGISLPFALGDKLADWTTFATSANAALSDLKSKGATADQYRAALKSIAGVLE